MNIKKLMRVLSINRKKTIEAIQGNTIGRVVAVNAESIDVQPVINKTVKGVSQKFPLLKNVPPIFMYGGESYEAMPIEVGDYCLLVVCERAFDNWYYGQDEVSPPEDRMFDISDCFALVGIRTLSNNIPIPSVITRRGDTDIEGDYVHRGEYDLTGKEIHTGDRTQTGNTTQTGNKTLNGGFFINNTTGTSSTGSGDIDWNGTLNITGDVVLNGISLDGHVHSGVVVGGGNTGEMV